MSKVLVTSGCSFSECISDTIDTWPTHLYNSLQKYNFTQHISCGMRSQGNGLISRHAQYKIIKALETTKPQDMLVCIMWSHSNRFDYRCEDTNLLSWGDNNKHMWFENPTGFVKYAPKNWVIGNVHWDSIEFSRYLRYFHSDIGAAVISLEHILRMQYFLKIHNIPYFFTDFIDNNIIQKHLRNNVEVKYLFDQLDKDQYLPITSEHKWVYDNEVTNNRNEWIKSHGKVPWIHPTSSQHKEFVDLVIVPWLLFKNYI